MKKQKKQKDCCEKEKPKDEKKGFFSGILYGILPHTFCIFFIVFSIVGATTATLFFKKVLLIPFLLQILIGLSFVFATLSAIIYLKRNDTLSSHGVKRKWKYLLVLYSTTVLVNLLFFTVIFPKVANLNINSTKSAVAQDSQSSSITIKVSIPCAGHSQLIIDEIQKTEGVGKVGFTDPNLFKVNYNSQKTSKEKILSLEIFKTYKATIIK